MFGFRERHDDRLAQRAEVSEMRLLGLQVRIHDADRIIRAYLAEQSELYPADRDNATADVLLELLVALGLAPAAQSEAPVIPGLPG